MFHLTNLFATVNAGLGRHVVCCLTKLKLPETMNDTPSMAVTIPNTPSPRSLDGRGLHSQTIAALALACLIPALVLGYLTVRYVLPHAGSPQEVWATIGFSLLLTALGAHLILRTVRQIQALTRASRSILDLHAGATKSGGGVELTGQNELLHLGMAITQMGDALRQQVVELQDKARQLSELNGRLEEANRKLNQYNEMKSNLVVLASREFRNPIGAILEGAALVLQHQLGDLNESQHRMLSVIHTNAGKVARLLQELLTIARVRADSQDFSCQDIDLGETLRRVVAKVSVEASRKQLQVAAQLPRSIVLHGYAQETELALECALANALDLASEESTLSIRLEPVGPAALVSIELRPLSVRAISFERLAETLNSPVTNLSDWKGTGSIELPLAKEIISLIGGRIGVEQSADHRLIFRVSLPLATASDNPAQAAKARP
jgi:signal transduction histidine kinase